MSDTVPILCPKCGETDPSLVRKHCSQPNTDFDSHTCDLLTCHSCWGYGTHDGKRWATLRGKK